MKNYYRSDSLSTLHDFALSLGISLTEMYSLWLIDCLPSIDTDPCYNAFTEIKHQLKSDKPSRMHLKERLELNERRLGMYLSYFLGPTYTQTESNILLNWDQTFRTKFSKVLQFGQRTFTEVPITSQTREFSSVHFVEQGFDDCLTFTLFVDQELSEDNLCNLRLYPDGYELKHGHRLRPYEIVSYNSTTGELVITFPSFIMVKPEKYIYLYEPQAKNVTVINGCDPDTYIENIKLYIVSYEYPHGYVTLNRQLCNNCAANGVTLCPACTQIKLPFCVKSIDPENGEFKVTPLIYDEDEQKYIPVDTTLSCCEWIESQLNDNCEDCEGCAECCHECKHYCDPCAMNEPLHISYSYLSGCSDYPYKSCCFEDKIVCAQDAIFALAASELSNCDCANCSSHTIDRYSTPLWDISSMTRTGIFTKIFNDNQMFRFGHTFGAVQAYQVLLDYKKRLEYVIV